MNKKLLQTLNSALERTKTTHYAPATIDALQARLSEELDWLDACPGRECLILLMQELAAKMRSARIVVSPGYSFLPDSYLLFLTGVTKVNPVEWDLPFSRFTKSVHDGAEIPFEAGSGCLEVARKVLSGRDSELVIETEPGLFEITFLDPEHQAPHHHLRRPGPVRSHAQRRLAPAGRGHTPALQTRGHRWCHLLRIRQDS